MDFKVAVSLWNQPLNQGLPAPAASANGHDFKARLGLDRQPDAQGGEHTEGDTQAQADDTPGTPGTDHQAREGLPSTALKALAQNLRPELVDRPAGLELYALGLRAGTHLSQVPPGLLASAEAAYLANSVSPALHLSPDEAPALPARPASITDAAPARASGTAPAPLAPDAGTDPITRLNETISAWQARKWPKRNCLLLPRGGGVELLIRDHHLEPDEQASLLAELLRRLPGSGVNPQQIWINGHPVWQRESLTRLQGDA